MKTPITTRLKTLMLVMGVSLLPIAVNAESVDSNKVSLVNDSVLHPTMGIVKEKKISHFTWGAEFGTSIDMSGYDSSTFNIDAMVGYRSSVFQLLGAGAGVHRSMGTGDNYIPIYGIMRTSFSKTKKLFFMNLKIGYSFNTIGDAPMFGDVNCSLGAGINLASGNTYRSYLILGYEFRHFNQRNKSKVDLNADDVSLVSISFGVNF